jgi:Na+-transporting methylmalonyl-CoA/oxaloacetate decarboxylase gamma subunit
LKYVFDIEPLITVEGLHITFILISSLVPFTYIIVEIVSVVSTEVVDEEKEEPRENSTLFLKIAIYPLVIFGKHTEELN